MSEKYKRSIVTFISKDRKRQFHLQLIRENTSIKEMSTSERDALNGAELYKGRMIWNTDLLILEIFKGRKWVETSIQNFEFARKLLKMGIEKYNKDKEEAVKSVRGHMDF